MVTLLITSVLVLGLLAIAIYFWQKPAKTSETIELPAPEQPPRGLFSDFRVNELRAPTAVHPSETAAKLTAKDFDQAIKAICDFQQSPDRNSTSKLLHAAALSDNPKNYERAIELVLLSWRDGSLNDLSAVELQSVINSEYWVLSSRTRISGAGFVLKQTLSNANRELETRYNPK
jgi:hypothetical protein